MQEAKSVPDNELESTALIGVPETEPEAILPDGVGLSLEQVQAILAKEHETIVPKDDPILMVVTLLNAFLAELERLQKRHESGLGRLMADKTDAYVSGVQSATAQLSESLSAASAESIKKVFESQAERLAAFKANIRWTAAMVVLSALVNAGLYCWGGLR